MMDLLYRQRVRGPENEALTLSQKKTARFA